MSNILQFLVSRPIRILITFLIILVIALRIIPYFIDADKYAALLVDRVAKVSGKSVTIGGKMEISLSTKLKLVVPNISIVDHNNPKEGSFLKANNLILSTSLFSFLLGDRSFDRIELEDAHVNIAILPNDKNDHPFVVLEKILTNNKEISHLRSIEVRNSIISYNLNLGEGSFTQANLSLVSKPGYSIEAKGSLYTNDEPISLALKVSLNQEATENPKIKLNIKSDELNVDFDGDLQNIDNKINVLGQIKSQVKSPELLMFELVKIMPFLEEVKQKDLNEPVNITSNFSIIDNNVKMTEIKVSSAYLNGTGDFGFSLNDSLNLEVVFDIDNLDVTKFASFKENELPMASSEQILDASQNLDSNQNNTDYINFAFIDTAAIDIALSAKQISMKDIELEDLKLSFSTNNGVINNSELEFHIKNGQHSSKVMLANIGFKKVDNTNLLLGDFINEGNNINETLRLFNLAKYIDINTDQLSYKIESKIIFAPKEISIFEIDGLIGDTGSFSGSIATKQQNNVNDYNLDLKFNNLKLENFELPLFKERLYTLLTKSKDDDYLSYFRWFRTLSSSYNLKFEFINTEFQNEKISDLVSFCKLSSGSMLLKGSVKSEFADGDYAIALTAKSIKPTISIRLDGNFLDYNRLKNLMFNFLDTSDNEVKPEVPSTAANNQIWSDKKINLFNIYKYDGQFDINIGSLKLYDQHLTDLKLLSHTSGEILYLDNIYFGIYGGQLQARGNISFFEQILYQFSFTASGLESKELIANSFPKINYFEGPLAITGSVVTQGDNPKALIANLGVSSNFAASGMNLNDLDADVVVDIALKRTSLDKNQILPSLDTALNSGVTNIMNLSGNLKATKGIFETKNAFFKTRFSSAIFAMSLDLNNLAISTNTLFLFLPYVGDPVSYGIRADGNLETGLQKTIDATNLLRYVKNEYKIVTAQDVLAAKQAEEQEQAQRKALSEDQDTKNYLYYKILEQKLIDKRKAEDNSSSKSQGAFQ